MKLKSVSAQENERTLKSMSNLNKQKIRTDLTTYIEKDCYQLGGVVMRISFSGEGD